MFDEREKIKRIVFKYVCSQVSTMAPSFLLVCKSIDSLVEHWLIQQFCTSLCTFLTEPPGHVIMIGDFATVCFNYPVTVQKRSEN